MHRLFLYYEEVYRKKEERMPKTLLWENTKPSLSGSPCHCRCYAIALRSIAVVAVAVVTLPPARHAGAASGEKQFQHTPSSCAPCQTGIHQIRNIKESKKSIPLNPRRPH